MAGGERMSRGKLEILFGKDGTPEPFRDFAM